MRRTIIVIIPILFVLTLLIGFIIFLTNSIKDGEEIRKRGFRKMIRKVDYHNKSNRAIFSDGSDIYFYLDFSYKEMRKYEGHDYDEFMHPGDSLIKPSNKTYFILKRRQSGEIEKLYFR